MNHGNVATDIATGLLELQQRIAAANIPSSKLDESINIATWNIREFGKGSGRSKKSIHYIAEILYQFDLIAITELNRNLRDLQKVMDVLGPYWDVVFSDYTADWGGNWERVGYLFDKRAVVFTGLASEVDSFNRKKVDGEYQSAFSWWRNPYIASFSAGTFDFVLITAHIRWGDKESDRIAPLKNLAEWVHKRRSDTYGTDKDIILMGDFNIPEMKGPLFEAITSKGLKAPKKLMVPDLGSNLEKNKRYDQILHYPSIDDCFTNHAGVLDFYQDDYSTLYQTENLSMAQFTRQLSDHLPLWIQINTDVSTIKLDQLIQRRLK
ncbi:MAG: endonuclease/exonuclease/phosphatase family protein [Calditrichaeota bacterium]|nr:endonuclease/exonuclease/phosphatase family protein [Calditrichota bacterium]